MQRWLILVLVRLLLVRLLLCWVFLLVSFCIFLYISSFFIASYILSYLLFVRWKAMLINPSNKQEMQNMSNTQVIIAALNEEEGIGLTITEMIDVLDNPQVIVVDGKSTDRTCEIAKNLGATVIRQDGKGKGDALAKALESIEPQTEFVVITDADFTYPAESVPKMIELLESNKEVGMVCGNS